MEAFASEFSGHKNINSWEMLLVVPEGELKTIFSKITIKINPTKLFYLRQLKVLFIYSSLPAQQKFYITVTFPQFGSGIHPFSFGEILLQDLNFIL